MIFGPTPPREENVPLLRIDFAAGSIRRFQRRRPGGRAFEVGSAAMTDTRSEWGSAEGRALLEKFRATGAA